MKAPQVFVDKVLISGVNYTRPFIVEREIKIGAGDRLEPEPDARFPAPPL